MLSKKSRSFKLLAYVQIKPQFYRHFHSTKRPKLRVLQRWQTITEFAQKTIMGFAKKQLVFLCNSDYRPLCENR